MSLRIHFPLATFSLHPQVIFLTGDGLTTQNGTYLPIKKSRLQAIGRTKIISRPNRMMLIAQICIGPTMVQVTNLVPSLTPPLTLLPPTSRLPTTTASRNLVLLQYLLFLATSKALSADRIQRGKRREKGRGKGKRKRLQRRRRR